MIKEKRTCIVCKKPMFNSWAGKWVNGEFKDIHIKCEKIDYTKKTNEVK